MSNFNKFKEEMLLLKNTIANNFPTNQFLDEGQTTSSFYKNLIGLFQVLKKANDTKDCVFNFSSSKVSNDQNIFYVFLDKTSEDCLKKLEKVNSTYKNYGITYYPTEKSLGMTKPKKDNEKTNGADDETKQREEYMKLFYGDNPLAQNLQQTNESLFDDINRIKSLING